MFFMLRCVFWLAVVYAHLPEGRTGFAPILADFIGNAGRHTEAFARHKAAEAPATVATLCAKRTEACLEAASIMAGAALKSAESAPRKTKG